MTLFWLLAALPAIVSAGTAPSSVALVASPSPSNFGSPVTLTATVTPKAATGIVTFYDNATVLGSSTVAGGQAALATILLPAGVSSLTAYYAGDLTYASSASAKVPQTVNAIAGNGFSTPAPITTGYELFTVVTADFNGDGKADLAAISTINGANQLGILLGNGDGTFQAPMNVSLSGATVVAAAGDFNLDGKTDLVIGTAAGVSVLFGNGDGTFQPEIKTSLSSPPTSVAVADFNGDGKADLVMTPTNQSVVTVLLGNGDGTFSVLPSFPAQNVGFTVTVGAYDFVAVGDFNLDGKVDLAVGSYDGGYVYVFPGNGDGTFGAFQFTVLPFDNGALYSKFMAVADFNLDGKPDVAVIGEDGGVCVGLGKGDGTFTSQPCQDSGGFPTGILTADFNGDGKPDIAISDSGLSGAGGVDIGVTLLLGNGDGSFGNPAFYHAYSASIGRTVPAPIVVADFNSDNVADLAVAGAAGFTVLPGQPSVALAISKTHTGNFALNQTGATWTITVSNVSLVTTSGEITVVDAMPSGATATAISGTGWSCTLATTTCTRSDPLAAQGIYPAITVTADIASTATSVITNVATVSGGGQTNPSSETASDPTTVLSPRLSIAKSHNGNFAPGQIGATWTITVSNTGGGPTFGTVSVVDTMPAGATATAIGGTGWSCTLNTLTCTTSNSIIASASYPAITVTANIATSVASVITNVATASGGGQIAQPATASDPTTILVPALAISKTHIGILAPGQTGATWSITVSNSGAAATSGTVSVVDTPPATATLTALSGTGWNCTLGTATCTRSDPLAPAGSYLPITVTATISANAPPVITNVAVVSGGGMSVPASQTASDPTSVSRPVINSIVDSASMGAPPLAPGSLATIFGAFLSFTTAQASPPLPASFGGTTVTVNGTAAPIQFVSASQINFQLPYEMSIAGQASIVVTTSSGQSAAFAISTAPTAPRTFPGLTRNANSSPNSMSNPAANGTSLTVFFTGAGAVTPAVADGAAAPSSPPSIPVQNLTVRLNGPGQNNALATAAISLTPGLVGVTQATVSLAGVTGGVYALELGDSFASVTGVYVAELPPTITSLTPNNAPAGSSSGVNVLISGSNLSDVSGGIFFQPSGGAVTQLTNNGGVSVPTSVSANIPATLLATAGVAHLYVENEFGTVSNSVPFYVTPFTISTLTPNQVVAGSGDTIVTVAGASLSTVTSLAFLPQGGGAATMITPTLIQAAQVMATLPASLLTSPGEAQIALANAAGALSNPLNFTILTPPATTTLTSSANPSVFGQSVTLTATLSPSTATGKVTFYDGVAVLGTSPVLNGKASLTTGLLAADTRSLSAYYLGDANNGASTSPALVEVVNTVQANGGFTISTQFSSSGDVTPGSFVIGDFNGDGTADVAYSASHPFDLTRPFPEYDVYVLLGKGDGTFQAPLILSTGNSGDGTTMAAGDFNGDGKTDLVLTAQDFSVAIYLGNGDGTFQTGSAIATFSNPEYMAVADFNHDGNADLAIAGGVCQCVHVLLGNGDGTFQPSRDGNAGLNGGWIDVADYNGDGIADVGLAGGTMTGVLLGKGDGTFPTVVDLGAGGGPLTNFKAGGKTSVAVLSEVFVGNGNGTFQSPVSYPGGFNGVATGDFDADGQTDLVTIGSGITILHGNGDGTFGQAFSFGGFNSAGLNGSTSPLLGVADFNGDGRPDLAYISSSGAMTVVLSQSPIPDLAIQKSHTGSFAQGQAGFSYTITVTNAGTGSTAGTVTVVDALPSGLTATAIGGTGWTCVLGTLTCTTANPLAASAGYPAITVTVSVAANAPGIVTNFASVSGGGETNTANDTASDPTAIVSTQPQTIAFGAIPTQIVGIPPFTLNASASSGLAVKFASNSTGVCTVSGTTLTLVAAGACSVTATQPGNGAYAAANPVTVTFTVDPSFGDVSDSGPGADESATFVTAIDDMLSKGITSGCQVSPLEYCPGLNVTRGQMAVFIIRSIYGSNNFSYSPTPYFSDATPSSVGSFFPYVQKMHELGITAGCTTTTYCPDLNVTRGQMAVFIIRARYGTSFNFDFPSTPLFTDATPDLVGTFFKYIQRMKLDNITSGCTTTTYCPDLIVTRDQMAVFMIRGGFNQLLPPTEPIIASASPATGGLGETINVTLTGVNTNFVQGTTTVSAGAGLTVGTVTVTSPASLTVQLTIAANATPNPVSLLVTTGTEEAVLPNGFTITSDPAAGLVAYWTGNNTTLDSVSGLSGTQVNGATYAAATSRTLGLPDAQAFSLNGTNSYVQAAAGETGTVTGARTLAAWVYLNPFTGLGQPILTASDIFGITGTTGTCNTGGPYQLYIDDGGTCYVSDNSLAPGVWSFVAVTFDGTSAVFYIDGVASVTVPAQMKNDGLATYEIGGNTLGGTSSAASFNGLLSEVQVYNRALTPAEIQGIYTP